MICPGANQLRDTIDSLNQRGGIGHFCNEPFLGGCLKMSAGLLPFGSARLLVEGDNKLIVDTVTGENQEILMKNGRTGRALDHIEYELGVLPYDSSGGVQTHRSPRTKMHKHMFAIQHGRGRGITIQPMF